MPAHTGRSDEDSLFRWRGTAYTEFRTKPDYIYIYSNLFIFNPF